jgi:inositol phosphorylceramide synthase catalytic subunit
MVDRLRKVTGHPAFFNWGMGPAVTGYGLLLLAMGRLRAEHIAVLGVWLLLNYWPRLRPFLLGLLPFLLFGLIYDGLRFVMPTIHQAVPPHVVGPYALERQLFGWHEPDGRVLLPTDLLAAVHSTPLLLASAFGYLFYLYEAFVVAIALFFVDRDLLRRFGWGFFLLSMMGLLTWCLYPAAPPWYVAKHGFGPADVHAIADPARLASVDAMLGIRLFGGTYSRASDVFGAMPSLHAADPVFVWLFVRQVAGRWRWLFAAFAGLVSFAAIFLGHHYLIDVLAGWAYAGAAYFAAEELLHRRWPEVEPAAALQDLG